MMSYIAKILGRIIKLDTLSFLFSNDPLRFICNKSTRIAAATFQCLSRTMVDVAHEKPVESLIRQKLTQAFEPQVLEVINESYMHNVPKGSESHFKVLVVSDKFSSQPLIKRHRMVNDILQVELKEKIHALSILAKTPEQWNNSEKKVEKSPPCQGGAGL